MPSVTSLTDVDSPPAALPVELAKLKLPLLSKEACCYDVPLHECDRLICAWTEVTFARWTIVSQVTAHSRTPQRPPRFSEAFHTAKSFDYLTAFLLRVKNSNFSPVSL